MLSDVVGRNIDTASCYVFSSGQQDMYKETLNEQNNLFECILRCLGYLTAFLAHPEIKHTSCVASVGQDSTDQWSSVLTMSFNFGEHCTEPSTTKNYI